MPKAVKNTSERHLAERHLAERHLDPKAVAFCAERHLEEHGVPEVVWWRLMVVARIGVVEEDDVSADERQRDGEVDEPLADQVEPPSALDEYCTS